jgi:hypothetical protein
MNQAHRLSISLAMSMAAISPAARATPPAAIAYTNVYTVYSTLEVSGATYSHTDTGLMATVSDAVPGTSAIAMTNASTGTVSVTESSTETSDGGDSTGDSNAVLTYFYDVVGTTKAVPIDISYYLTASRSLSVGDGDTPGALARIIFYQNFTDEGLVYDNSAFAEAGGGFFGDSTTVDATYSTDFVPGETYGRIDLVTEGSSEGAPGFSSSSYAMADPEISIDPSFLEANPGVTLEISPGVGNSAPSASPAPEPAAWALMLVGGGAVGAVLRSARRRRGLGPATA